MFLHGHIHHPTAELGWNADNFKGKHRKALLTLLKFRSVFDSHIHKCLTRHELNQKTLEVHMYKSHCRTCYYY
jgi:hypothetical protein